MKRKANKKMPTQRQEVIQPILTSLFLLKNLAITNYVCSLVVDK